MFVHAEKNVDRLEMILYSKPARVLSLLAVGNIYYLTDARMERWLHETWHQHGSVCVCACACVCVCGVCGLGEWDSVSGPQPRVSSYFNFGLRSGEDTAIDKVLDSWLIRRDVLINISDILDSGLYFCCGPLTWYEGLHERMLLMWWVAVPHRNVSMFCMGKSKPGSPFASDTSGVFSLPLWFTVFRRHQDFHCNRPLE